MKTHVTGQAAAVTAALTTAQAQRLAELRYTVLDTVNYSTFTTADEKARTAASVARCQSADVLVKWYCNVLTLLSERELAPPATAPTAPVASAPVTAPATLAQQQQVIKLLNYPAVSRPRKSRELLRLPKLNATEAATLIAELLTLTTTPPTRPAGAGVTVDRRGQLAVAAWTNYARDPETQRLRLARPGEEVALNVTNN